MVQVSFEPMSAWVTFSISCAPRSFHNGMPFVKTPLPLVPGSRLLAVLDVNSRAGPHSSLYCVTPNEMSTTYTCSKTSLVQTACPLFPALNSLSVYLGPRVIGWSSPETLPVTMGGHRVAWKVSDEQLTSSSWKWPCLLLIHKSQISGRLIIGDIQWVYQWLLPSLLSLTYKMFYILTMFMICPPSRMFFPWAQRSLSVSFTAVSSVPRRVLGKSQHTSWKSEKYC